MVNEAYERWLNHPNLDPSYKKVLETMSEQEKNDAFYTTIEFGTAGMRGLLGPGTNRINLHTIRKANEGFAAYIEAHGEEAKARGVAIGYDNRHMSPEFAMDSAKVLAKHGIRSYVFESLRPTPELSYAVRKLGCIAGINITASHNPPEYNGYKVYWEDGAQITPPHDTGIMAEVQAVAGFSAMKTMDKEAAKAAGLYETIGQAIDDSYIEELKKQVKHWDSIKAEGENLKIVYTPLHGTGNIPVRRVLKELGFTHVYVVPEQELPDGDFPTVSYPNPEAAEAFALALKLAKEKDADLVLATDPDADRLGVYVKDSKTGEYHSLTGNMSGCLIGDYVIGQRKELFGLPKDGAFIRSIVSTNMADAIAEHYGIQLVEVLTGFKFIGQKMLEFEKTGNGTYLFGMEESYGCLTGTYARDKDAVVASMTLCEAAAYYKTKNMTLWDAMLAMYEKYGYYKDDVTSITLKGIEGLAKIQEIMNTLRENAPAEIGGYRVTAVRDYKKDTITDTATSAVSPTGLPSSNVLYYEMTDGAWVCVRPSGTEPKVKFYLGVKGDSLEDADKKSKDLSEAVHAMIDKML